MSNRLILWGWLPGANWCLPFHYANIQSTSIKSFYNLDKLLNHTQMPDIFLSYSSTDRVRAKALAENIARRGWSVWWDREIPYGKAFDEVIEQNLDASRCVIVLWTKQSVSSAWVKSEAAEGASRGILIPILFEAGVKIPLEFRRMQSANLSDWRLGDVHPEFDRLLESIADILGRSEPSKVAQITVPEQESVKPEIKEEAGAVHLTSDVKESPNVNVSRNFEIDLEEQKPQKSEEQKRKDKFEERQEQELEHSEQVNQIQAEDKAEGEALKEQSINADDLKSKGEKTGNAFSREEPYQLSKRIGEGKQQSRGDDKGLFAVIAGVVGVAGIIGFVVLPGGGPDPEQKEPPTMREEDVGKLDKNGVDADIDAEIKKSEQLLLETQRQTAIPQEKRKHLADNPELSAKGEEVRNALVRKLNVYQEELVSIQSDGSLTPEEKKKNLRF